ncbi:PKD domain-containing protein [Paenarthrobacter sp. PH39-S1]|uniref:PKD domain-containing protein n=1 Tax=Paenarthrobacter sp. PH39-S1 TaxID=3046204 RepID=UPI0024B99359|nr:PKD domain-containing protein [Paenarthrobacter sp. PH39-S1]MDJ0356112.1 PKD domain-containing protein [Paenarthrobacter sp. PH39-S1]
MFRARVFTGIVGWLATASLVLAGGVATAPSALAAAPSGVAAAPSTRAAALTAAPSVVPAAAVVRDGSAAAVAASSCWEIKTDKPSAADGTYWLLTPAMAAPDQFYCDMTTDGGGWVLVGKGREGWTDHNEGTGSPAALRTAGLSPMSRTTAQYPAQIIDSLLNNGRVDALSDGIRLKRAMNAAGTQWQESRFNTDKGDRWVWTFGAAHKVAWFSFTGVRGSGGLTSDFGPDNAYRHINTSASEAQSDTAGFAYGTGVAGTNSGSTYLWSASNGTGSARPYTEMFLRPQLRSTDPGFTRIPDTGTAAKTNIPVASSTALDSPWGVAGPKASSREGDIEVQAFVQSGNRMYVGGNFSSVQRAANSAGTDRVPQAFLAAFDVATGELIRGFTPVLNGSVMDLTALPNGNIVAAGTFSSANGAAATAIVALDPVTGATVPNWSVKPVNRMSSGTLSVGALSVRGNWLYLGGAFTHMSGGSRPGQTVYLKNAARVSIADGTPDAGWNPEFNGTVMAVDTAEDGSRLYAAGYFSSSGTVPANHAAAVRSSAGAPLATPSWKPVWSDKAGSDYQNAIAEVGGRIWVGGGQHSLFTYSPATFARLSGFIGVDHGDFQTISTGKAGMVYAGSHGNQWLYSNAFNCQLGLTCANLGTDWTEADSFGWIGAWDAVSGDVVPSFTPRMTSRLGRGVWASTVDSNGALWAGGDLSLVATSSSERKWAGGLARFPQTDAAAPSTPSRVIASADTTASVTLGWASATDGSSSVSYQILRDDRVVATTSALTAMVPKSGENRFFVRAVDAAGNLSSSAPVLQAQGDGAPPAPPNASPTAGFSWAGAGLAVQFNAAGSADPDGTIAGYAWDFGDGAAGSGLSPSHAYAAQGSYQVRLTVTDDQGATGTAAKAVAVTSTGPAPEPQPVDTAVVPARSSWNWRFEREAPPAAWKDNGFDATAWKSGSGPLGFGGSGPGTNIDVTGAAGTRPLTAYFVRQFNVSDPAKVVKLKVSTVANDGVVVYVNGTEVGRRNMPAGPVSINTYASSSVRTSTADAAPVVFDVPVSLLVRGTNVIAAETHLNYHATADLGFDLSATLTSR